MLTKTLLVLASLASTTLALNCNPEQLLAVYNSGLVTQCSADSDITLSRPPKTEEDSTLSRMCESFSCMEAARRLQAVEPFGCDLTMNGAYNFGVTAKTLHRSCPQRALCDVLGVLSVIASNDARTCDAEADFSFSMTKSLPNNATMTNMCRSGSCIAVVQNLQGLGLPMCTTALGNGVLNMLVDAFPRECVRLLTASPGE